MQGTWLSQSLPALASHLSVIKADIAAFRSYLRSQTISTSALPNKVLDYVFANEGKKFRPSLFFFLCKLLGYQGKHLLPMAAVSEYVHTASLLHDDVVDSSTLRRCQPTVHSKWGDRTSILVGDLIYAHASELMAATGSLEIVKSYAHAIKRMSEGELLQLDNLFRLDMEQGLYLQVISYKTAELLAATCMSAAILAMHDDGSADQRQTCYRFGYNIGIAFQLVDDALDYSSKEMDKDRLADFANGRVTMPMILLYQRGDAETKTFLRHAASQSPIKHADLVEIKKLAHAHNTVKSTVELAHNHTAQAIELLSVFPSSPAKASLIKLVKMLMTR
ncbi:MAG: polyprenyl synthetase family protein [Pseudomonadota bacterium]|nr:polyprenyl synthetase family protein [Pseudomonadota bacterium]